MNKISKNNCDKNFFLSNFHPLQAEHHNEMFQMANTSNYHQKCALHLRGMQVFLEICI